MHNVRYPRMILENLFESNHLMYVHTLINVCLEALKVKISTFIWTWKSMCKWMAYRGLYVFYRVHALLNRSYIRGGVAFTSPTLWFGCRNLATYRKGAKSTHYLLYSREGSDEGVSPAKGLNRSGAPNGLPWSELHQPHSELFWTFTALQTYPLSFDAFRTLGDKK